MEMLKSFVNLEATNQNELLVDIGDFIDEQVFNEDYLPVEYLFIACKGLDMRKFSMPDSKEHSLFQLLFTAGYEQRFVNVLYKKNKYFQAPIYLGVLAKFMGGDKYTTLEFSERQEAMKFKTPKCYKMPLKEDKDVINDILGVLTNSAQTVDEFCSSWYFHDVFKSEKYVIYEYNNP